MNRIRAFFEKRIEIDDEAWDLFISNVSIREYPADTTLLHVGTTENHLSYIGEGIVRAFIPNQGNDITFDLAFKGQFVCAYDSFLSRDPSTYRLETLTDTTLLAITHADLQQMYHQRKIGNIIGRLAAENIFERVSAQRLGGLNLTPEERYDQLATAHPHLIDSVPLPCLASYLDVTVATLGRIRSKK